MKNITFIIALAAALLSNIVSIDAMSRLFSVPKRATPKGIRSISTHNRVGRTKMSNTEKELSDATDEEIKGYFPEDGYEDVHTDLFEVATDKSLDPKERTRLIKELHAEGIELNNSDLGRLTYTEHLAYLLNMKDLNAPCWTIDNAFQSLMAKCSDEKLQQKIKEGKITKSESEEIKEHREKVRIIRSNADSENFSSEAKDGRIKFRQKHACLKNNNQLSIAMLIALKISQAK